MESANKPREIPSSGVTDQYITYILSIWDSFSRGTTETGLRTFCMVQDSRRKFVGQPCENNLGHAVGILEINKVAQRESTIS